MAISGGRDRRVAAALFALSFVLCAVFSGIAERLPVTDDALSYYRIAVNVSRGAGFSEDGVLPQVYRPPLFSGLLGAWFFATGSRSIFSVHLYQSLCIALSTLFAFLLARELLPRFRAAVASSLWVAVHPSLWSQAGFVLQEPTILLATTIACWRTAVWLKRPGALRSASAGACWGLATLAKAVTIFLPALLAFLWIRRGRKEGRMRGAETALALLAFVSVILPWTARNYQLFHRFIPVNDQAAGMLEWNVLQSDAGAEEGKGWIRLLAAQLVTKNAASGDLSGERFLAELDRDGIRGKERDRRLREYVGAHKKYFLVQRLRNAVFFAFPSADWWMLSGRLKSGEGRSAPFLVAALLLHGTFYLFFFWRLFLAVRGEAGLPMTFLALFFACYWGIYALLWGEFRFAIPVYPVLFLFAPWERLFRVPPS